MHLISVCVCALPFQMTIKINEMILMHYYDNTMGIKQSTKRPYKCDSTTFVHHHHNSTSELLSLCTMCNVCIHIETIDILFIEMTFALLKVLLLCSMQFALCGNRVKGHEKNAAMRTNKCQITRWELWELFIRAMRIASRNRLPLFSRSIFYALAGCHFHFHCHLRMPYLNEHLVVIV